MSTYSISSDDLLIDDVAHILKSNFKIKLDDNVTKKIVKCRSYLDNKLTNSSNVYYGINTGFGSLCNRIISSDDLGQLQRNLVMSHACGMGDEVGHDVVKLMLLLKIKGLSLGHSGVTLELVERLIFMYNNNIFPVIYKQGSLGASGDLAPLAHLALPLIGEGYVDYNGQRLKSADLLKQLNLKPLNLQAKEGLALLNGTQFMSAHAVDGLIRTANILHWADTIGAMSIDAFQVNKSPFIDQVHLVRNHPGQLETARNIRLILEGSELFNKQKDAVQDPYSFRCIPQVHGATKDVVNFIMDVVETEINSVTDNPTIFPDDDLIISAGNFHGQPLALSMDQLAVAVSEIGSISERRVYKLISGQRGLPDFLVEDSGLNSGLMIPQYSAASIVSKNKQLCTPSSVDTIDSSNGQEDHVSMGANAATKTLEVIENVEKLLAIELFTSSRALEFRKPEKSSDKIEAIISEYRKMVPFKDKDSVLYEDLHKTQAFISI
ncbi:MAG: histidine ammonia-lyase [Crocinitomicaceae bacterium]|nr:histidine ammonia-lyase [Crocinitomicaceae bacterium]